MYDIGDDVWTVYANFQTPIPSEYVNDSDVRVDGTVWIATDNRLVREQGDTWTAYITANAPLLHNVVREVEMDSRGASGGTTRTSRTRTWPSSSSMA